MSFAQHAAKDTVDECQSLLKQHDWNCQSIEKAPMYNLDLKKGEVKRSIFIQTLAASNLEPSRLATLKRPCKDVDATSKR